MNERTDRLRHDRSSYERPTLGWRCGRSANWNAACKHGPTAGGACGGESACKPTGSGDSWQCRRSAAEGGSCANGPGKGGVCGMRRPPCVPRRTFAMWRGRVSTLVVGATFAIVALLALRADMSGGASSLDPGPLSSAHSHFASASSCGTCHTAFGRGAAGWWQAFWSPAALMPVPEPATSGEGTSAAQAAAEPAAVTRASLKPGAPAMSVKPSHRLSAACVECHGFGGNEQQPHNRIFADRADKSPTDCLMCHTEHKGRVAQITTLSEAQCQTCHTRIIKDFASGHAAFGVNFPYDHPQAVRFDHSNHFNKHFATPAAADKVPTGGCVGCHVVGQEGRAIRPANFQTICANCHSEGIAKRDFVFFRWPEIETNTITADDVTKACGASADVKPAEPGAKFSAVGTDQPTALAAYLLGVPPDSAADYDQPIQDLARTMMSDGADPLVDAVRERLNAAKTDRLFAGFDTEQVRQAACAWGANQEYTPPGKAELSGWRADALELRYTRPSHADPVIRAWIETVAAVPPQKDAGSQLRLDAARKELLSADGPGQCMKCHSASGPAEGPLTVSWQVQLRSVSPQTRFNHRPHLDLLGPEKTCTSCHQLGDSAASAETGGLKPIVLATCTECHAAGQVRDECRTCHVYHQDHAFKKRMMQDAKK